MSAFWVFAVFALAAHADQPAYCDHPFDAVCNSQTKSKPTLAREDLHEKIASTLEAELKEGDLFGKISSNTTTALDQYHAAIQAGDPAAKSKAIALLRESMKSYSLVLNRAQDLILAEFKKLGISEDDLNRRLAMIRKDLADEVGAIPSFQGKVVGVGTTEIANTLQSAEIVSVRKFKVAAEQEHSFDFYRHCGIDGLESQAYYIDSDHGFRICPGFLLLVLRSGSLDGLTFVASHELGHSIGVERSVLGASNDSKKPPAMVERYRPFLKCVEKNFARDFASIAEKGNYILQKGLPALKARLSELKKAKPLDMDEVIWAKRQIEMAEEKLDEMADTSQAVDRLFPPKASAVEQHALEICADAVAYSELDRLFTQHPPADPWQVFAAQFRPLCEHDKELYIKLKYGPKLEDGMHPTTKYRIEAALRDPGIRKALGCRPLDRPTDPPYCSLEGEVRPTTLPGAPSGVFTGKSQPDNGSMAK